METMERFKRTMKDVNRMAKEDAEASLETDYTFNPDCGMTEFRGPSGRCEECKDGQVQDNWNSACISVGANPGAKDGEYYLGTILNGKYHGMGEYRWENGDRMSGNFFEGQLMGWGQKYFNNGSKYEGDFQDG